MKKKIIQLGGLGNQMFIYAFYYAMKKKGINVIQDVSLYNKIKMHNGFELLKVFGLNDPLVDSAGFYFWFLRTILHFKPNCFLYEEDENNIIINSSLVTKAPFIKGYWQSDMYFSEFKEEISEKFIFKNISNRNRLISSEMHVCNSVSIHIRRGDYLNIPGVLSICSEEYYSKAIKIIKEKMNDPHFYIFSNDSSWSLEFMEKFNVQFTIISHNTRKDSYQDMFLMTQCRHNILANSSFSWWGAYLNSHVNAIKIAPKNWCQGHSSKRLIQDTPSDWLRL